METAAHPWKGIQALLIPKNRSQASEQLVIHVKKALDGAGRGKHRRKEPARVGFFTGHGQKAPEDAAYGFSEERLLSGKAGFREVEKSAEGASRLYHAQPPPYEPGDQRDLPHSLYVEAFK